MALIKENIEKIENELTNLNKNYESLMASISEYSAKLNNDENYQIFVSGTEIGRQLNDKVLKIIDITKNLAENELQNIIKISFNFVQLQKELNQGGN